MSAVALQEVKSELSNVNESLEDLIEVQETSLIVQRRRSIIDRKILELLDEIEDQVEGDISR